MDQGGLVIFGAGIAISLLALILAGIQDAKIRREERREKSESESTSKEP